MDFAFNKPYNRPLLAYEFGLAGLPTQFNIVDGILSMELDLPVHDPAEVEAVIAAHDDTLLAPSQQLAVDLQQIEAGADVQAANIPGWASWTETEALAWHDTNITDVLPVANLTEANDLLATIAQENRAIVRLLIALRNKQWPNLQGS